MYHALCSVCHTQDRGYHIMPNRSQEKEGETVRYLYDLTKIKYAALISPRHNKVVQHLASDMGCNIQVMRKILMENVDMILLESIASRYEAYTEGFFDTEDEITSVLKPHLYTRVIPIISEEQMNRIRAEVQSRIDAGTGRDEACSAGKKMVAREIGI